MNLLSWNDDCLKILPMLETESIDLIIVDPPYGIARNTVIKRKETKDIDFNFGEWDVFPDYQAFYRFTGKWFAECVRVLKPEGWIYIFFAHEKHGIFSLDLAPLQGIMFRNLFTWVKSNPAPSYRKYNWISSTEAVWVGSKGKCRIPNFLLQTEMRNTMTTTCRSNYGVTGHPTEKPVQLIQRFILTSSNEGDRVLDCFMGSGTTGVACKELNRKFIGVEQNKLWYNIAINRINNASQIIKEKEGDALLV